MKRNVGLIGAGAWGKNLARNFLELGALHTVCDFNSEALTAYPDVNTTTSDEEILNHPEITRIAIAAPVKEHYWLARAALERGKDVLVEKPLCLTVVEAEELKRLAKEKGRVLMVGHLLRYHCAFERLLELVQEGVLGQLQYISANRLNLGRICTFENSLWDFAPHDLSMILALTGGQLPDEVRCTGGDYLQRGIADVTLTSLSWESGLKAHMHVSWLNPFKEHKLTLIGSEGAAVFDDTKPLGEKLRLTRAPVYLSGPIPLPNPERSEEFISLEPAEPLKRECEHFLRCCDEQRVPLTDGEEALRVVRVLAAAQASLEESGAAKRVGAKPPLEPTTFPEPTLLLS